jgi:hypothetical protein
VRGTHLRLQKIIPIDPAIMKEKDINIAAENVNMQKEEEKPVSVLFHSVIAELILEKKDVKPVIAKDAQLKITSAEEKIQNIGQDQTKMIDDLLKENKNLIQKMDAAENV